MKTRALIFISILVIGQDISHASGKRTPEQSAVIDVIHGIQLFEGIHSGKSPTNWSQLSETLNLQKIDESLSMNSAPRLEENYAFVTVARIPVSEYEKGEVVFIRLSPLKYVDAETGEEKEGRYFISRHEGSLRFNWLAETNVQKMLTDAGVTELPRPEPFVPSTNLNRTPPMTNQSAEAMPALPNPVVEKPIPANQAIESPAATQTARPTPVPSPEPPASSQTESPSQSQSPAKWLVITVILIAGAGLALVLRKREK